MAAASVRVESTRLFHISLLCAAVHRLAIGAPDRLMTASAFSSACAQLADEP